VDALESVTSVSALTHVVLTHLNPKRIQSLRAVLKKRQQQGDAPPLEVYLSNPALQLLRSSLGASHLRVAARPA
jgi:flavorubredoxin